MQRVFYVGDVKQSIYQFRRAEPALFMEKQRTFSSDENALCRKISLNRNYRSRETVLASTNRIFERVMHGGLMEIEYDDDARLYAGRPSTGDVPTTVHVFAQEMGASRLHRSLKAQLVTIARDILQRVGSPKLDSDGQVVGSLSYRDFTILAPKLSGVADVAKRVFAELGVDLYCEGGLGAMDSDEIGQALTHLRLMDNLADDLSLLASLRGPAFGFDERDLAAIRLETPEREVSFLEAMQRKATLDDSLGLRCRAALDELSHERFLLRATPLDEYLWGWLHRGGLYAFYGAQPNGLQRQANLRMLCQKAGDFVQKGGGLHEFLTDVDTSTRSNDTSAPTVLGPNEDVVRMMTIHKSKGLEFPIVYLMLMENDFSAKKEGASELLTHPQLGAALQYVNERARTKSDTLLRRAIKLKKDAETRAERARLLYVAMTRAKSELVMLGTKPKWSPERMENRPSTAGSRYETDGASSMFTWILDALNDDDQLNYAQYNALSTGFSRIKLIPQKFSYKPTGFPQEKSDFCVVFHSDAEEISDCEGYGKNKNVESAVENRRIRLQMLTERARMQAQAAFFRDSPHRPVDNMAGAAATHAENGSEAGLRVVGNAADGARAGEHRNAAAAVNLNNTSVIKNENINANAPNRTSLPDGLNATDRMVDATAAATADNLASALERARINVNENAANRASLPDGLNAADRMVDATAAATADNLASALERARINVNENAPNRASSLDSLNATDRADVAAADNADDLANASDRERLNADENSPNHTSLSDGLNAADRADAVDDTNAAAADNADDLANASDRERLNADENSPNHTSLSDGLNAAGCADVAPAAATADDLANASDRERLNTNENAANRASLSDGLNAADRADAVDDTNAAAADNADDLANASDRERISINASTPSANAYDTSTSRLLTDAPTDWPDPIAPRLTFDHRPNKAGVTALVRARRERQEAALASATQTTRQDPVSDTLLTSQADAFSTSDAANAPDAALAASTASRSNATKHRRDLASVASALASASAAQSDEFSTSALSEDEPIEVKRLPLEQSRPKLLGDLPRQPSFLHPTAEASGVARGTATHRALSLMDYAAIRAAMGLAPKNPADNGGGAGGEIAKENAVVGAVANISSNATVGEISDAGSNAAVREIADTNSAATVDEITDTNSAASVDKITNTLPDKTVTESADLAAPPVSPLPHRIVGDVSVTNAVLAELSRMESARLISHEERISVDARMIARFFLSDVGKRALLSDEVHREWSFNLRLPEENGLIVQGVIDLCFVTDGAWELVDYKTDRVASADDLYPIYGEQLSLYRRALEECTDRRVAHAELFALNARAV